MRRTVPIVASLLTASSALAQASDGNAADLSAYSPQTVIPAQAGIHGTQAITQPTRSVDTRFRGYDGPDSAAFASDGAFFVHSSQRKGSTVLDSYAGGNGVVIINPRAPENALAVALARAWKRDFIEEGVEETRNVLLECQHETSVVLTTPLMRSDAQQAHCYRF
jgi:hypothetical protein